MSEAVISPGNLEGLKGRKLMIAPAAEWVTRSKIHDFERINSAPVTSLLSENQVHAPTKTSYSRNVHRLESSQAVQQLSRVELSFDPEMQSMVIHAISVFRHGSLINHAHLDEIELLRREQRMDSGILNGEVTVLLIIKDVRIGDVLDVEYSIIEDKSVFGKEIAWFQNAGHSYPLGRWRFVWIDAPGRELQFSPFPAHLEYSEKTEEGLIIREWSAARQMGKEPEPLLPPDVLPHPYLLVTSFESWGQMVDLLLEHWDFVPEDGTALKEEIALIRGAAGDDALKIVELAVASARDAVRYQNYSPGLLSLVPVNLTKVWARRYGDCKEKSLLLCWFLQQFGLDADPVLVHSVIGQTLENALPAPMLFDHVVTRVTLPDRVLWIDPTNVHRGGSPSSWTGLSFAWGLPLEEGSTELVAIPEGNSVATAIQIKERVEPATQGTAVSYEYEITMSGTRADWLRAMVDSQGMAGLRKFLSGFIGQTRGGIELEEEILVEDDRAANRGVIKVKGSQPEGLKKDGENSCYILPLGAFSFAGWLPQVEHWKRVHPLFLGALDDVLHEIEVRHPKLGTADYPSETVSNEIFTVKVGSRMQGAHPVYFFSGKTFKDRVSVAQLASYKQDVPRAYGCLDMFVRLPYTRSRFTSNDPESKWGKSPAKTPSSRSSSGSGSNLPVSRSAPIRRMPTARRGGTRPVGSDSYNTPRHRTQLMWLAISGIAVVIKVVLLLSR